MAPKRILVVGGAGYVGSQMVASLLEADHRVVVLDDLSKGYRDLLPGGQLIVGSCGDAPLVASLLRDHGIEAVMHFAAYSLVGESVGKPLAYYRNNVGNTAVLLEEMVKADVRRFIFSSTAAVYGEPQRVPIVETDPIQPTNPYGTTKANVEAMLRDTHYADRMQYCALRYFNAAGAHPNGGIGERHDPETHLIPLVLKVAAGERNDISIFGTDYPTRDGTCERDYVHVADLAQAHLLALSALFDGLEHGVYNLGSSIGHTVREVIETAERVTGRAIAVREAPRRPGDPAVLIASSEKIRRELGWRPRYESLETIIATAWRWHQSESAGSSGVRSTL